MTEANPFTKTMSILGAILGATLLFAALLFTANAAASPTVVANPTLWLQVPAQPVKNNTEITVTVRISDVVNLYGVQLDVNFDPTALQVVDLDAGTQGIQIESAECPVANFVLSNSADNSAGTIAYAVTQLNPTPPVNGNCSVANIRFKTTKEMTTTLSFSEAILSDPDGTAITTDVAAAELEIVSGELKVYLPTVFNLVANP